MPIDAELLATLLDRHAAALVLLARQWCHAAEDVVQEAFLKLAEQPRLPDKVGPWLFTVVRRAAISQGRKEQRRRRHEATAAKQARSWFVPNPAAGLVATEVSTSLALLPAEQREIVVAHLWGGLKFQEIAELVGTSASSAHRSYQDGLAALRQHLEGPCPQTQAAT